MFTINVCVKTDFVLPWQNQWTGRYGRPWRAKTVFLELDRVWSGVAKVPTDPMQSFAMWRTDSTNYIILTIPYGQDQSDRFFGIFLAQRIPGRIRITIALNLPALLFCSPDFTCGLQSVAQVVGEDSAKWRVGCIEESSSGRANIADPLTRIPLHDKHKAVFVDESSVTRLVVPIIVLKIRRLKSLRCIPKRGKRTRRQWQFDDQ